MLWLVWSSIQISPPLFISARSLFHLLTTLVFIGLALLISVKNFAFKSWLIVWHQRPNFWPIWAFDIPSSLNLIISSFLFKVRDMWFFLSLEHLEVIVGLSTGRISILCLGEKGEPRRGKELGEELGWWSTQSTHIYLLNSPFYIDVVCGTLKQL